jgi:hypothetical protein
MTLAQRMADGRMPVLEALRIAMRLAETLRVLHEGGGVHGALTPAKVEFSNTAIELLPAAPASPETLYTAPEVAHGRKPDARADVFSFGAILFEMLAGRPALVARTSPGPVSSGSPAVDRVLASCLAPDPDARAPRMQRVILELKLLTVAAKRAEAARARKERADLAPIRNEMREMEARLESRLASRLTAYETAAAALQKSTTDALAAMRRHLAEVEDRLDEMDAFEQTVEDFKGRTNHFEQRVAGDLSALEQSLKDQTAAIDAARVTMAQTDEMVKRVVEALESLQTAVLDAVESSSDKTGIAVN